MTEEKKVEKEEKIEKAEVKKEEEITEEDISKTLETLSTLVKARESDEEEEEAEEEEDEEEEKSYTDNFEANDTLAKAIEVSDFLASLVDETETSIAAIGKDIGRFVKSQSQFDTKFIGALEKLSKTLEGFDVRIKKIEESPVSAGPKSVIKSAQALEKSFVKDGAHANPIDAMSRPKVASLLAKAVQEGKINDSVLFSYEGNRSFQLRDAEKDILKAMI